MEIKTSTENLPLFLTSQEVWEKIIGKDRICENNFYKLVNRAGCPKVKNGRKCIHPTLKFIEWLENEALGN